MDFSQGIFIGVIAILTTMLVFLGVQVFILLRDLRQSLKKVNNILEETEVILESVKNPLVNLSHVLTGLHTTGEILGKLFGSRKARETTKTIAQKGKKVLEKVGELSDELEFENKANGEVDEEVDGETNGEKEVHKPFFEFRTPRLFRGIPKRR